MMKRKLDQLGRIVIPKEMRRKVGLQNNDPVELQCDGNTITLSKSSSVCRLCGAKLDDNAELKVCRECAQQITHHHLMSMEDEASETVSIRNKKS